MENETSIFREKPIEELKTQLDHASVLVQGYLGQSLLPPSLDNDKAKGEILSADQDLIWMPFQRRWEIYRKIINIERTGRDLTEEEREKFSHWLTALNNLDDYITAHKTDEEKRVLYDRQFTVFEELREFLEDGGSAGYVRLPTGVGKTVLFVKLAEATGLRTLAVTPTKILVDQTGKKFEEFAPDLSVGKVYSYEKNYGRQVTITTYQSFLKGVGDGSINPKDYDLLILDEAHKSLTKKRMEAVNQFDNAIRVGFTATTKYSETKKVDNLLRTIIHTMTIREAVTEELMSPFYIYIAKTDVDLSEVRITRSSDANDRDLDRAVNITSRNQGAVEVYRQLFDGQKAIVYCVSVEHAQKVAELFREKGIVADTIHGYQNKNEQRQVIEAYRNGEISVVCNADILIEGFDEPTSTVCINLRPTSSPLLAEQRAGRVLRIDPNNPGKHAYIVDFIDEFENANFIPVSLAQIIEGAHVYREAHDLPDGYKSTGWGTPHYPWLEIEGLKVITDVEEIMRMVNEMKGKKYPEAEEGWMSLTAMRLKFRLHPTLLRKLLEPFRETNPEYFELTRGLTRRIVERYSPELVEYVSKIHSQFVPPIEGWISMNMLASEIGVTRETVIKRADSLRKLQNSQFKLFRISTGQLVEHVSPDLANVIKKELERGEVPHGWVDCTEVSKLLDTRVNIVKNMLTRNFEHLLHSESIMIRAETGNMRRYISPYLISRIKEKTESVVPAPNGWITIIDLAQDLGISKPTLNRLIEVYRADHPHFFKLCISDRGKVAEHCSPALVEIVKNLSPYVDPEEGWVTVSEMARQLGMSRDTAKRIVNQYRDSYSEHFRFYRIKAKHSGGGIVHEHISTHLAKLITEDKSNLPGESGWMYNLELTKELRTSYRGLNNFVDKYRQTNPEYFKVARGSRNRSIEYFSPELIALASEHFGKRKQKSN